MSGKKVFPVKTEIAVKLTEEDIDGIMVAALEGGVTTCWCRKTEVVEGKRAADWGHEQIARGGALILHDAESSDKWELTLDKFLNGFKLWLENDGDEYGAVSDGVVDCCNIDATCADEIIQYALFGELVFG